MIDRPTCPDCGSGDVRVGTRGTRYCADCGLNTEHEDEKRASMPPLEVDIKYQAPKQTGQRVTLKRLGGFFGPAREAQFEVLETTNIIRPLVQQTLNETEVQGLIDRGVHVTIKRK